MGRKEWSEIWTETDAPSFPGLSLRFRERMALVEKKGPSFVVSLSEEALDIPKALEFVSSPDCGAISLFLGTTRQTETNPESARSFLIQGLHYEAYPEMAIKEMARIAEEASRAHVAKCYISHRVGYVAVGEASILVVCSSRHRTEAHQQVMNLLNQVKSRVPVWKRACSEPFEGHSLSPSGPGAASGPSSHHTSTTTPSPTPCPGDWSTNSEAFWINKNTKA